MTDERYESNPEMQKRELNSFLEAQKRGIEQHEIERLSIQKWKKDSETLAALEDWLSKGKVHAEKECKNGTDYWRFLYQGKASAFGDVIDKIKRS